MQKIGIIGAGAFGTALASVIHRTGRDVIIHAHEAEVVDAINSTHENAAFLPGITLDPAIRATNDIADVCDVDAVVEVVPSKFLRSVLQDAKPHWKAGTPIVVCSKGIEADTCKLMSEVCADVLGDDAPIAILTGPTFAAEVARGLPAALTLACADQAVGEQLIDAIGSSHFRIYYSNDVVGAQLGSAVKNVLAIACGIVEGRGLGDSARAALITRGLAEINRLGKVLGAQTKTLMGLSGLGDLTLTCNAMQSRNFSLGVELGRGRSLDDIVKARRSVAEGVHNAATVTELARRNQVDMPICLAVNAVVDMQADLDAVIHGLLSRPTHDE